MRQIIEYTLASIDGVFSAPQIIKFSEYRDDAYYRDGLGQALACEAMLMGRTTYEQFAKIWPARSDPWADRLNNIPKYVFSSTLQRADWTNSVVINGDVATEVAKLKNQDGGNLLVYGHGLLAQTLLKAQLIDLLDVAIHPIFLGSGEQLFHEGLTAPMKLVATKTLSKIVKLTYEPQYQ